MIGILDFVKTNIALLVWVVITLALFVLLLWILKTGFKYLTDTINELRREIANPRPKVKEETLTEWLEKNTKEIKKRSRKNGKRL